MIAENYQGDPIPSKAALVYGTDLVMTLPAGIREQVVEITIGEVISVLTPLSLFLKSEQTDKRKKGD